VLKAEVRFFHWVAKMADSRSRRPEQRAGTPAPPAGVEYQAFTVRRYLVHAINRACRASHSPACAPVTAERMACAGVGFVHLLAASPAARAVWTNRFADGPHIWRARAKPVRSPAGSGPGSVVAAHTAVAYGVCLVPGCQRARTGTRALPMACMISACTDVSGPHARCYGRCTGVVRSRWNTWAAWKEGRAGDHIVALTNTMAHAHATYSELHIILTDIAKAYDTAPREALLEALAIHGFPPEKSDRYASVRPARERPHAPRTGTRPGRFTLNVAANKAAPFARSLSVCS